MLSAEKKSMTQSNHLIQASYKMTLTEKRVLMLAVSKVNPIRETHEPLSFRITVQDWHEAYPDDPHPWRSMQRGGDRLLTRFVTFTKSAKEKEKVLWFDKASYQEGEGVIEVNFGWTMSKYLANQLKYFTTIPILEVSQFKSIYSIRLYELLSQYKHTGILSISLEDFRFSMACNYPQIRDLKDRVLNPALLEINSNTPLNVSFKQVKRGKTITAFQFFFEPMERNEKITPIHKELTKSKKSSRHLSSEEMFADFRTPAQRGPSEQS